MFDAVDTAEAMHLLPPDTKSTYSSSVVVPEYIKEKRTQKWMDFYMELREKSTDQIIQWSRQMFAVGQRSTEMIEIKAITTSEMY